MSGAQRLRDATLAIAVAVAAGASLTVVRPAFALAVPLLAGGLALGVLLRGLDDPDDPDRNRWLRRVTAATLVGHLAIGLVIASSRPLIETFGGDALGYHARAVEIVDQWNSGGRFDAEVLHANKEGFYFGLAAVYWVVGPFQVAGIALNACFSAATVPVVHDTTRRLFGREAARSTVILFAVLPGFLVWTSQLLREALVVLLLAVAANAAVRLTERASLAGCIVLGGSLCLLFTVRANMAVLAAAGIGAGIVLGRPQVVAGATTAVVVAALLAALVVGVGIGDRAYDYTARTNLETVDSVRQDLSTSAGSGYATDVRLETPADVVGFLPRGLPAFALGPFPWSTSNLRQAGGLLEAMTLWALLPSLVRGWRRASGPARRRRLVLGVPAAVLAVGFALAVGNYGTVVRERLQVSILLLPVVAYGWTLRPRRRRAAAHRPVPAGVPA